VFIKIKQSHNVFQVGISIQRNAFVSAKNMKDALVLLLGLIIPPVNVVALEVKPIVPTI